MNKSSKLQDNKIKDQILQFTDVARAVTPNQNKG